MPEQVSPSTSPNPPTIAATPVVEANRSRFAGFFTGRKRKLRIAFGIVGALVLIFVIIPRIFHAWRTVSTDDAYVNSYVTFVAPRVSGQVARVLVDDNNRVKKGDVLVELDPEPFRVQVAIKQAAVESAQANLVVAQATVRSQIGQARALRFKLQRAIEDVDNQVAVIRARVATWEQSKATQVLAQAEFERSKKLLETKVASKEEFDQRREQLDVANAAVKQALQNVYQARAALGLPAQPAEGANLADVPANLDQTFSSVRQALADLMQSASQLGVVASSWDPDQRNLIVYIFNGVLSFEAQSAGLSDLTAHCCLRHD